ncbi:MAG: site-specific integrase [Firmicutes bacterium]|nr:site-specific integrase [Bacillota bacterium]
MRKIKSPELFRLLKDFLTVYLPMIRKKSDNTVSSYRIAMNLYLTYIQESQRKQLPDVIAADFNQKNILGFMNWLANNRKNEVSTINQRLSHIRGFCKYMMKNDFISYLELNDIAEIAKIPDIRKNEIVYLTIQDMQLVLKQPNLSKKTGIRDKFYIALLYDSGCRDQEILDLKIKDFVITKNGEADLHVVGKGNKYRVTPITEDVVKLFRDYCNIYHPNADSDKNAFLFYTVRNGITAQMSDDNVQRFLKAYELSAKVKNTELPHLHPHLFRATRAMHLYMAGVPLALISEWLGHSKIETTTIYASATTEMKRKAVEKLILDNKSVFDKDVIFKYADNDEILKRLYGLK